MMGTENCLRLLLMPLHRKYLYLEFIESYRLRSILWQAFIFIRINSALTPISSSTHTFTHYSRSIIRATRNRISVINRSVLTMYCSYFYPEILQTVIVPSHRLIHSKKVSQLFQRICFAKLYFIQLLQNLFVAIKCEAFNFTFILQVVIC